MVVYYFFPNIFTLVSAATSVGRAAQWLVTPIPPIVNGEELTDQNRVLYMQAHALVNRWVQKGSVWVTVLDAEFHPKQISGADTFTYEEAWSISKTDNLAPPEFPPAQSIWNIQQLWRTLHTWFFSAEVPSDTTSSPSAETKTPMVEDDVCVENGPKFKDLMNYVMDEGIWTRKRADAPGSTRLGVPRVFLFLARRIAEDKVLRHDANIIQKFVCGMHRDSSYAGKVDDFFLTYAIKKLRPATTGATVQPEEAPTNAKKRKRGDSANATNELNPRKRQKPSGGGYLSFAQFSNVDSS